MAGDGRRRSAASSSASPSCAAARRSASPPRRSPSAPSPLLACAGLAIIPRYTMLAAAVLAIFAAARACSAGGCWSPATPGGARWQVVRRPRRADVRRLGCRTSRTSTRTGRHRPHQPGPDRGRPHRPRRRRRLRAALRADRRPQPPRRPPPRLRPRRRADPDRQRQRGSASPRRGYFLAPASRFVIHNFILDPNDPTRFSLDRPAAGFQPVAAQRVLEGLPPLLSRQPRSTARRAAWVAAARSGSARSTRGGSSTWRSLEGSSRARRPPDARVEHVAAAAAVLVDEVQVVAADLDPLDVGGEAEAEHRPARRRSSSKTCCSATTSVSGR